MNKKFLTYLGLITLFFVTIFLYIFKVERIITDSLYLLFALIPVIAGIITYQYYNYQNIRGKSMFFIILGLIFLFIGEAIWFIYTILNIDPYPSIADLFFVVHYPLFFIGIYLMNKFEEIKFNKLKKNIFTGFILLGLFNFLYFGLYLTYDSLATFAENFFNIFYNFGDLFLIISAIFISLLATKYRKGKLFLSSIFFGIGLIFTFVGDLLFAIFTDAYEEGIRLAYQLDIFWILGFLFFTFSFVEIYFFIKDKEKEIKEKLKLK